MPPINPAVSRALRSSLSSPNRSRLNRVGRELAGTTRTAAATALKSLPKSQPPTPFLPSDYRRPSNLIQPTFPPSQSTTTPFTALIDSLVHSLTTTPSPSLPHLTRLLRAYTSNSLHWSQYAHGNPAKQYTRNLVAEVPGLFNLLLLVWTPGKASPIHDHADAHCLMKVLKGDIIETRYAMPRMPDAVEGPLMDLSSKRFGTDKVTYMSDEIGLHSIANPHQSEYAVSLHLYTPPNAALRGCHIYDPRSGQSTHVAQCPYDSVNGVVADGKA